MLKMRSIATDGVAWSVCMSVFVLVTFVSSAKTVESILGAVWVDSLVGPRNHKLDMGQDAHHGNGQFWEFWSTEKYCRPKA